MLFHVEWYLCGIISNVGVACIQKSAETFAIILVLILAQHLFQLVGWRG